MFGGQKTIEITANREWEVKLKEEDTEWLEFSPTNGGNNTVITVEVEEMPPFGINRYATLQLYPNSGDDIDTTIIIINQLMEMAGYLNAEFEQASSTTGELSINSDLKWVIENASHEWIKLGTILNGEGDRNLTIDLDEMAEDQDSRNGEIVIVSDDSLAITRRVSIIQLRSGFSTPEINQTVWPNPVYSQMNIKWKEMQDADIQLSLYDVAGREVWNKTTRSWQSEFEEQYDLHEIPQGVYFLQTKFQDQVKVEKILKH